MKRKYKTNDIAKKLFKQYSKCIYCKVDNKGKILVKKDIIAEYICIEKDGTICIEWNEYIYDSNKNAPLDAVSVANHNCIEGVFSSEKTAIDVAKEWFQQEKLEKIAQLEEQLAELKKDL